MVLIEVEDDAGFDDLDKPTFLGLCTLYSGIDSLVNHPFAVSTTVAELHKAAGPGTGTGPIKLRGWGPRYSRFSLSANLSMAQSLGEITANACPPSGGPISPFWSFLRKTRYVYTGFPVNFMGLLSGDLCQMVAYNYVKSELEKTVHRMGPNHPIASHMPVPAVSGFIAMTFCAVPCNAAIVIFRHQVKQRCLGNDHSMFNVLIRVIPSMEGGLSRVLLRGTLISSAGNIPSAAIGWQVYESSKDYIRKTTGSHGLWTSLCSGGLAGGIDVLMTRPLSVIMARVQTNHRREGVFAVGKEIIREEGYGALYKGLGSQMLSNVPRMAVFYGLYSTFVTWARNVSTSQNAK